MNHPTAPLDGSLRTALEYAISASPYYRELLGEDPVPSAAADLPGLPFTSTSTLAAAPTLFRAHSECTVYASSGTTGRPKYMYFSRRDHVTAVHRTAASMQTAGVGASDVVAVAHGFGIWLIGSDFAQAAAELGACVVPVGKGPTAAYVLDAMRDLGVTAIASSPSYLRRLAATAAERDGEVPVVPRLLLSGETISTSVRRHLRREWSATAVTSVYGSAECGTLAAERPMTNVLELHVADFAFEVVDTVTDEWVDPGSLGELVLTSLRHDAMPLVRYRTGDLVSLVEATSDGLARSVRILGRLDESVVLESGEKLWPHQIDDALATVEAVADWQATLTEVPSDGAWLNEKDRLTVEVVLRPGHDHGRDIIAEAMAAVETCSLDMTAAAQATVEIEVVPVSADGLRSAGSDKVRRLVDERMFPTVRAGDEV